LIRRSDLAVLVIDLQTEPTNQLEQTLSILENHHIQPSDSGERNVESGITFLPMIVLIINMMMSKAMNYLRYFAALWKIIFLVFSISDYTAQFRPAKKKIFQALNLMQYIRKSRDGSLIWQHHLS